MSARIPIAGPWITDKEIRYVNDAVAHGWYAGPRWRPYSEPAFVAGFAPPERNTVVGCCTRSELRDHAWDHTRSWRKPAPRTSILATNPICSPGARNCRASARELFHRIGWCGACEACAAPPAYSLLARPEGPTRAARFGISASYT